MPDTLSRPIRVLIAKVGLDGHDRGAKVVAAALRDAGMEVIYTGLRKTPEVVVRAAEEEDVDAVGVSILSGAHGTVLPRVRALLDDAGLDDVLLVAGGTIPSDDADDLMARGIVDHVFTPGASLASIAEALAASVAERRGD
ncbi:methylmalonyl-CoA mutase [Rubrivirga sp. SAORIC476]|uniref:cobalamin B12-binding domain-containing protein n=1 Tax=Rubrivirga sp. SAORIC476 TaxID=1961794 RepID=UPI000BA93972|nr:cobalamin B12-binding domain-containing protein [Rubrivirga sp. SAORIC476]MAQ93583.1 methylmalonyl-CoA mutase [Rhodothermaceae bacterium]MAS54188.1 methylmalonyl-CoA mutase [Pimelobacter sp.]MBC13691.1 methylmalonyl-CoA mutase [Rhodothermaceae bacterium]PAP82434.1 methylmalonyl-CoA mutase [Rubrivirga sp. SAORIC476]